jgi:ACS family hexuronate transporter-like MFS transporter
MQQSATAVSRVPLSPSLPSAKPFAFWGWVVVCVAVLSNVLNFLDRQVLASVAPTLKTDFHISNTEYGLVISVFSLVYAATAPVAGLFLDRVGLRAGVFAAVTMWSLSSTATAMVQGFRGLLVTRAMLGFGEAAALPFLSKANASYLPQSEWGLAQAVGAVTVTIGSMLAPLLAAFVTPRYGWRMLFVVCGMFGLVWMGLWYFAGAIRSVKPMSSSAEKPALRDVLSDRRLWSLAVSYALVLSVLILWLNWTTIYLVREYHLTQTDANRYFAWIPPLFAPVGSLFNGWLTFHWIRKGTGAVEARTRVAVLCAPLFLATAIVPFLHSAGWAVFAVGVGLFASQSVMSSLNILPIDLFGVGRAAFTISLLGCAYSLMQMLISPLIGLSVDHFGFAIICWAATILPLAGTWIMRSALAESNVRRPLGDL